MILASQSPRRIELMREAGYDIRVIPADIDETPFDNEAPLTLVERLARAKAAAVAAEHADPSELTIAADTIVTFDARFWVSRQTRTKPVPCSTSSPGARIRSQPASASLEPETPQPRTPPRACRLSM